MSVIKAGTKVLPPHVFANSWPITDQLMLCECVVRLLTHASSVSGGAPATAVDWALIVATVAARSGSAARAAETPASCQEQYATLATALARSIPGAPFPDALSLAARAVLYLKDIRMKDLARDLVSCKDNMRVFRADVDFADGRALDPALLQPAASALPAPPPMQVQFIFPHATPSAVPLPVPNVPATPGSAGSAGAGAAAAAAAAAAQMFAVLSPADTRALLPHVEGLDPATGLPRGAASLDEVVGLSLSTTHVPVVVRVTARTASRPLLAQIVAEVRAHPKAGPFQRPVQLEEAPRYLEVIRRPMDLGTVAARVESGEIAHAFALFELLCTICTNAYTYNAKNADIWLMAKEVDVFISQLFQNAFPELADIFPPSTADSRRGLKRPKPQRPGAVLPPVPVPGHAEEPADAAAVAALNKHSGNQSSTVTPAGAGAGGYAAPAAAAAAGVVGGVAPAAAAASMVKMEDANNAAVAAASAVPMVKAEPAAAAAASEAAAPASLLASAPSLLSSSSSSSSSSLPVTGSVSSTGSLTGTSGSGSGSLPTVPEDGVPVQLAQPQPYSASALASMQPGQSQSQSGGQGQGIPPLSRGSSAAAGATGTPQSRPRRPRSTSPAPQQMALDGSNGGAEGRASPDPLPQPQVKRPARTPRSAAAAAGGAGAAATAAAEEDELAAGKRTTRASRG